MLKRSWFCKCGYTFDEEVGDLKSLSKEGAEGKSLYYCSGCGKRVKFEWRVVENTDPDDKLDEPSEYCSYCEQVKPIEIMRNPFENYSHPVCDYCVEVKNKMDLSSSDITRIGQFDSDNLFHIRNNPKILKMVEEGRIGLEFEGNDGGNIWVTIGDEKAFGVASEIIG